MTDQLNGGADASAAMDNDVSNSGAVHEASPRGAIDRAFAALDAADDAAEAGADKAASKPAPGRAADGKFSSGDKSADATKGQSSSGQAGDQMDKPAAAGEADKSQGNGSLAEPPQRFSADAKAAWKDVPESVRGEVVRALKETESGIEKYRADATVYTQVFKPFVDLAVQSNIDPRAALQGYVQIDQLLHQDFNAGIAEIFRRQGISPQQWAAQLVGNGQQQANGQQPQPSAQDREIVALRQQLADLQRGLGGVTSTIRAQTDANVSHTLETFTASLQPADQALFAELDQDVADILQSDPRITLPAAFDQAKKNAQARYQRLFGTAPASAAPAPSAKPAASQPPAHTQKGQLSVTGAPGSGSNPGTKRVPSSAREAIDAAFEAAGL